MRLYLDASAIIYSVEGVPALRQKVLDRILEAEATSGGMIITSRLSRLECRILPLRKKQTELLSTYELFFARQFLTVAEISASVVEQATDLRVRHGLRTPDAIHMATAMDLKADLVLTGDKDMARCTEVAVELL